MHVHAHIYVKHMYLLPVYISVRPHGARTGAWQGKGRNGGVDGNAKTVRAGVRCKGTRVLYK